MSQYTVSFPENKRVDVAYKNFKIKTDQLKENGGDETAPEPFTVFLSSIAACAGIYAKSFCDFRKLDTTGMHLILETVLKEKQKLIDQINITVHVNQQFPEKYIKPIIKTIDSCAVKNQLHPDINTQTAIVYMNT